MPKAELEILDGAMKLLTTHPLRCNERGEWETWSSADVFARYLVMPSEAAFVRLKVGLAEDNSPGLRCAMDDVRIFFNGRE